MSSSTLKHSKIDGILFDLDGTLLDTAADLAAALNHVLKLKQLKTLSIDDVRPNISTGVTGLLNLGGITTKDPTFPSSCQKFLDYYRQHICIDTHLFPDVKTLINYLQEKNGLGVLSLINLLF